MAGFHLPITGWFCAPTDSLARFRGSFVILAIAAAMADPSEGSLDDPTFGQDDKSLLLSPVATPFGEPRRTFP
jgi:hypothetical protein